METDDIFSVNQLFREIYPYVARQIAEAYGRSDGLALEIGPYGPGISIELARLCPALRFTVGDDSPAINDYLEKTVQDASLADRIEVRRMDKFHSPFPADAFDLVYFRGALFFWGQEAQILREIHRVLKAGGVGMAGGGFGASTPDEVIERILQRSHELNLRLGKKVLSEEEVKNAIEEAGLASCTEVDHRHGLWVIIRKPQAQPHHDEGNSLS